MTDVEGYKWALRKEEANLLAERKRLLTQKQLFDRIFTSDAARKRADLERDIAGIERRVSEIRAILGDTYRNN